MRPIPIFTVFYSTTFSIAVIILLALLLISPADHIYRSLADDRLYYIFLVSGAYFLTLLIAAFIWAGRLYKSRSALAAVPRRWNPLEKGDAPRRVGRLVREGLEKSAKVAFEGRPRERKDDEGKMGIRHWGVISHPGWSSPESKDLPSLHLPPIILELPHLIEAKAVSLAPAATTPSTSGLGLDAVVDEEAPAPSQLAISLLQRPAAMDLRDYLAHLSSLGLINPPDLAPSFLALYENARFSAEEMTEFDFRALMSVFAELLRGMTALDAEVVEDLRATEEEEVIWAAQDFGLDGTLDDDRPRSSLETTSTVAHTPMPEPFRSASASLAHASQYSLAHSSQQFQPPPDSPAGSVVQHRGLRTPSIATLKSFRSRASTISSVLTGGSMGDRSVIHMADAAEELDLPRVGDSGA